KLCKAHKVLSVEIGKQKIQSQKEDKFCDDQFIQELKDLKLENAVLKSSLNESNEINAKFVHGEKNLKIILGQQRFTLNKRGIGFTRRNKNQSHKNPFVRATNKICNYCGKFGQTSHKCFIRNDVHKGKLVWVPKGQTYNATNPKGPKLMWVPKH